MKQYPHKRPSASIVVSIVALVVASASSATAATMITGSQIQNGSVSGKDIKKRSLSAKHFKKGTLKAGAQGPVGAAGPTGAQGAQGPQGAQGAQGPIGPSNAYEKAVDDFGQLPDSFGTIATLLVNPNASYVFTAKAVVDNNDSAGGHMTCKLSSGGTIDTSSIRLGPQPDPAIDREMIVLSATRTIPSGGLFAAVSLDCHDSSGNVQMSDVKLTAIRVGALSQQ